MGLNQVHIVGHDLGGAIGMRLAVFKPRRVASLTIVDSVSYDSWPSETCQQIICDQLDNYAAMPEDKFRELLRRRLSLVQPDPVKQPQY